MGMKAPLRNYATSVLDLKPTHPCTHEYWGYLPPSFARYAGKASSVQWLGYWLDNRNSAVRFQAGERDFSLLRSIQTESGAQLAFYSVGTAAISSRVKGSQLEGGHSPPPSPAVKNEWCFTPTPHMLSWRVQGQLHFTSSSARDKNVCDFVSTSPFVVNGVLHRSYLYSIFRKKLCNWDGCWYISLHSFFCDIFITKLKETRK